MTTQRESVPWSRGVVDVPGAARSRVVGRRSWRRRLTTALVAVLVLAVVVFAAGSWYFSGRIRSDALKVEGLQDQANVVVTASGSDWVELEPTRSMTERLASDNVYGLEWPGGFGILRAQQGSPGDRARRTLEVLKGSPPSEGTAAQVRRDVYPLSPGSLVGFEYSDVTYRSPAGTFPAFFAGGTSKTWAILVHGRGATRAEMFRLMRETVAAGLPSLDIGYRHDREAGGGLATFGQDEWRDLEAAVRYATDHGAEHVVLLGTSMGGAIAAAFLEHSSLAPRVSGLVLDAAMLDFTALIRQGAADIHLPVIGGVPDSLVWGALQLAHLRFGLDLDQLDYLDDLGWVRVPVLAFHGTADPKSPVAVTRRLHDLRPDLVTAVIVPGAGHVESWNADPEGYEHEVREFLDGVVPPVAGATG